MQVIALFLRSNLKGTSANSENSGQIVLDDKFGEPNYPFCFLYCRMLSFFAVQKMKFQKLTMFLVVKFVCFLLFQGHNFIMFSTFIWWSYGYIRFRIFLSHQKQKNKKKKKGMLTITDFWTKYLVQWLGMILLMKLSSLFLKYLYSTNQNHDWNHYKHRIL